MTTRPKQRPCLQTYCNNIAGITAECILRHDHQGPHWGPTNPNPDTWQPTFQTWNKGTTS